MPYLIANQIISWELSMGAIRIWGSNTCRYFGNLRVGVGNAGVDLRIDTKLASRGLVVALELWLESRQPGLLG